MAKSLKSMKQPPQTISWATMIMQAVNFRNSESIGLMTERHVSRRNSSCQLVFGVFYFLGAPRSESQWKTSHEKKTKKKKKGRAESRVEICLKLRPHPAVWAASLLLVRCNRIREKVWCSGLVATCNPSTIHCGSLRRCMDLAQLGKQCMSV